MTSWIIVWVISLIAGRAGQLKNKCIYPQGETAWKSFFEHMNSGSMILLKLRSSAIISSGSKGLSEGWWLRFMMLTLCQRVYVPDAITKVRKSKDAWLVHFAVEQVFTFEKIFRIEGRWDSLKSWRKLTHANILVTPSIILKRPKSGRRS